MGEAKERHRAATAEFTTATAAYESALMSGDEDAIAVADARLTAADRTYSETLAALVRRRSVRLALPSFAEMLTHPWTQPPEPTKEAILASIQEYANAKPATAGMPFRPSGASDA